jgi:two-component system chemotaxis response regulator CheY
MVMSRILVADDAAFMRMMLSDILQKAGHEVIGQATNGREALAKYQELKPDLLVSDITMPDMDGIEAVREIRKIDPHARIIMCTALTEKARVSEAIQFGAIDFVLKPFKADQVLQAIQKVLSMKIPAAEEKVMEQEAQYEVASGAESGLLDIAQNLLKGLSEKELSAVINVMQLFSNEKKH